MVPLTPRHTGLLSIRSYSAYFCCCCCFRATADSLLCRTRDVSSAWPLPALSGSWSSLSMAFFDLSIGPPASLRRAHRGASASASDT